MPSKPSTTATEPVSLSQWKVQEPGFIRMIRTDRLNPETVLELLDFGLLPGSPIRILEEYPSQKKILISLPSSEVVLRLDTAEEILVSLDLP